MDVELSEAVTLAECPPGLFEFGGSLGFKTEYGMTLVDENGANMPGDQVRWKVTSWPDAYCLESGEVFWGGTKTHEERAKLLVRPATLTRPQSVGVEDGLVERLIEVSVHLFEALEPFAQTWPRPGEKKPDFAFYRELTEGDFMRARDAHSAALPVLRETTADFAALEAARSSLQDKRGTTDAE